MKEFSEERSDPVTATARPIRADAQRNLDALLEAAKVTFAASGVDVAVREIAEHAKVGIGTVYRHFPQRADLIAAVFRREIDDCVAEAAILADTYPALEALSRWMQRYADFVATKRGLAIALHSGDPTYEPLPAYFRERLQPALQSLLSNALSAGQIRADVKAKDLLDAVASLCMSTHNDGPRYAERMVALLVDGLRFGASST